MNKFLQELRRRHVYRTFALYVVAAWVIIQVVTAIFEAFDIDKGLLRFLWIAFAAGSPFALIFSWIYDITPEGIVHTPPREGDEDIDLSLHGIDYFLIGAFLIIMVTIGYGVIYTSDVEIEDWLKGSNPAIAVLPLRDISPERDLENFGYAVSEAVLTNLSHLKELDVIASGSSFQFQRASALPEIRTRLNVDYVVEGSINRNDELIVVTARLIDAGSGRQMWAKTYEAGPGRPFDAQQDIAMQIADHLDMTLGDPYQYGGTTNFEAYEAFVQFTRADDEDAMAFLDLALEHDPNFAAALQYKAWFIYIRIRSDLSPLDAWKLAKPLLDRALEITDKDPVTYTLIGEFKFRLGEFGESEDALKRALEISPSEAYTLESLSRLYSRLGRNEESIAIARRDVRLNPLSSTAHVRLANRLWTGGDDTDAVRAEAIKHYEKAIELAPGSGSSWHDYAGMVGGYYGETSLDAFRVIVRMQHEPALASQLGDNFDAPVFVGLMSSSFTKIDDYDRALRLLNVLSSQGFQFMTDSRYAEVYLAMGDYEQALDFAWRALDGSPNDSGLVSQAIYASLASGQYRERVLDHVRNTWPELLEAAPVLPEGHEYVATALVVLLREIGEEQQATALLQALESYAQEDRRVLPRLRALGGDYDEAASLLEDRLRRRHWFDYDFRPGWGGFANTEAFSELTARIDDQKSKMRSEVEEMISRGDLYLPSIESID